jgi:hypothetical protein
MVVFIFHLSFYVGSGTKDEKRYGTVRIRIRNGKMFVSGMEKCSDPDPQHCVLATGNILICKSLVAY